LLAALVALGVAAALVLGSNDDEVAAKPADKSRKSACTKLVGGLQAAEKAVAGASPGDVVCLRDGEYGEVSLRGDKSSPGVTLRAAHPGQATLAGADLDGSFLALARFAIAGQVTIEPGSRKVSVLNNRISGGYFGVEAGPTTDVNISDTTIRGNKFVGPFGEDAIRLNRYHDSGDRDPYGVLIDENEITNVRENGNHSDCLQSVWGGDGLYFRKNYLHDNRCQGFFVNDQPEPVRRIVIANNLMLRNAAPCAPPSSDCGPPLIVQIIGPTEGISIFGNTVWTDGNESPVALREGPFGKVAFRDNAIYRSWTDWSGGFPNYSESDDLVCKWEGFPRLSPSSKRSCHPHFMKPRADDYRLADGRGVSWSPAQLHFGP